MMAPSKKLLAALAAVFLLNILVIGGVQSLTTPALAAVYQQGSQGETVRQIQTKLKRWGYYDGEVDGIYGSATTEAVKYFQRRNGLTADGIAGNATLQAIAEQSRIVRLPLNQVSAISKINQVTNEFIQQHNRRPSIHELSELTGIDESRIRQSQNADNHHMSIDAPFSDDDDNSMADMLSGGEDSRTDRSVDFESMSDDLKAVLKKTLKDREITIVTECFGIGCHEKGLEEIGTEMGLTRERVRQIREKAIEKIRESGNARVLMKYLG